MQFSRERFCEPGWWSERTCPVRCTVGLTCRLPLRRRAAEPMALFTRATDGGHRTSFSRSRSPVASDSDYSPKFSKGVFPFFAFISPGEMSNVGTRRTQKPRPSMNTFLLRLLVILYCSMTVAAHADTAAIRSSLDDAIDRAIADHRVVGAVVLVLRDGGMVYHRAAGYADRRTRTPITESTVFRLSSLSKPITTVTVLALVDQGKIALAQPVTDFLPEFRPALPDGTTPIISIRELLDHTAGLSYGFLETNEGAYHKSSVSDGMDESNISLDEDTRRISAAGLANQPGTKWHYSVSLDVLGGVIAKASGKSFPEIVRQLVTGPLHMTDTDFWTMSAARLATAYIDGKPEPTEMADPQVVPFLELSGIRFSPGRALRRNTFPSGGAGMVGTAGDMARLLEAVRLGGQPIVTSATAQSMMANQTGDLPVDLFGAGWGFGFGGAVLVDPSSAKTPQSRGTWAWGGVYGHSWFVDPVEKLTVVVMTNTAFEGMAGKFPMDVRDAIYKNIH